MGLIKKLLFVILVLVLLVMGLAFFDLGPGEIGHKFDQIASHKDAVSKPLTSLQKFVWETIPSYGRRLRRMTMNAKEEHLPSPPVAVEQARRAVPAKAAHPDQLTPKDRDELDNFFVEQEKKPKH